MGLSNHVCTIFAGGGGVNRDQYKQLVGEDGEPIRWKTATMISVVALLITVSMLLAKMGARNETLDKAVADIATLQLLPPRIDRIEVRFDEFDRRLVRIELKLDRIIDSRNR